MNNTIYYALFILLVSGFLFTGCGQNPSSNEPVQTVLGTDNDETINDEDSAKGGDETSLTREELEKGQAENSADNTVPSSEVQSESSPQTNYGADTKTESVETTPAETTGTIYANGTYTYDASYASPAGQEPMNVTFTIENDLVKAVSVTVLATDENSKYYQQQFAANVSAVVVGKKVDEASVGKISGASLTSQAFNNAISALKSGAKN